MYLTMYHFDIKMTLNEIILEESVKFVKFKSRIYLDLIKFCRERVWHAI